MGQTAEKTAVKTIEIGTPNMTRWYDTLVKLLFYNFDEEATYHKRTPEEMKELEEKKRREKEMKGKLAS